MNKNRLMVVSVDSLAIDSLDIVEYTEDFSVIEHRRYSAGKTFEYGLYLDHTDLQELARHCGETRVECMGVVILEGEDVVLGTGIVIGRVATAEGYEYIGINNGKLSTLDLSSLYEATKEGMVYYHNVDGWVGKEDCRNLDEKIRVLEDAYGKKILESVEIQQELLEETGVLITCRKYKTLELLGKLGNNVEVNLNGLGSSVTELSLGGVDEELIVRVTGGVIEKLHLKGCEVEVRGSWNTTYPLGYPQRVGYIGEVVLDNKVYGYKGSGFVESYNLVVKEGSKLNRLSRCNNKKADLSRAYRLTQISDCWKYGKQGVEIEVRLPEQVYKRILVVESFNGVDLCSTSLVSLGGVLDLKVFRSIRGSFKGITGFMAMKGEVYEIINSFNDIPQVVGYDIGVLTKLDSSFYNSNMQGVVRCDVGGAEHYGVNTMYYDKQVRIEDLRVSGNKKPKQTCIIQADEGFRLKELACNLREDIKYIIDVDVEKLVISTPKELLVGGESGKLLEIGGSVEVGEVVSAARPYKGVKKYASGCFRKLDLDSRQVLEFAEGTEELSDDLYEGVYDGGLRYIVIPRSCRRIGARAFDNMYTVSERRPEVVVYKGSYGERYVKEVLSESYESKIIESLEEIDLEYKEKEYSISPVYNLVDLPGGSKLGKGVIYNIYDVPRITYEDCPNGLGLDLRAFGDTEVYSVAEVVPEAIWGEVELVAKLGGEGCDYRIQSEVVSGASRELLEDYILSNWVGVKSRRKGEKYVYYLDIASDLIYCIRGVKEVEVRVGKKLVKNEHYNSGWLEKVITVEEFKEAGLAEGI